LSKLRWRGFGNGLGVEQDASIRNATFRYELHDFNVFYGGAVQPAPRLAPPPR